MTRQHQTFDDATLGSYLEGKLDNRLVRDIETALIDDEALQARLISLDPVAQGVRRHGEAWRDARDGGALAAIWAQAEQAAHATVPHREKSRVLSFPRLPRVTNPLDIAGLVALAASWLLAFGLGSYLTVDRDAEEALYRPAAGPSGIRSAEPWTQQAIDHIAAYIPDSFSQPRDADLMRGRLDLTLSSLNVDPFVLAPVFAKAEILDSRIVQFGDAYSALISVKGPSSAEPNFIVIRPSGNDSQIKATGLPQAGNRGFTWLAVEVEGLQIAVFSRSPLSETDPVWTGLANSRKPQ